MPNVPEPDWIIDEIHDLSKQKQQCWLRWKTSSCDCTLHEANNHVKLVTSMNVEVARNIWWEEKAEKAEKLHEQAMRNRWGGSMIRKLGEPES